ncbi:hypothetical protein LSAT2_016724 [Lamellibrachia satsuma]|nr:hypothetical protein LSAT2_016724 [Lamellibrachia satsuma]
MQGVNGTFNIRICQSSFKRTATLVFVYEVDQALRRKAKCVRTYDIFNNSSEMAKHIFWMVVFVIVFVLAVECGKKKRKKKHGNLNVELCLEICSTVHLKCITKTLICPWVNFADYMAAMKACDDNKDACLERCEQEFKEKTS